MKVRWRFDRLRGGEGSWAGSPDGMPKAGEPVAPALRPGWSIIESLTKSFDHHGFKYRLPTAKEARQIRQAGARKSERRGIWVRDEDGIRPQYPSGAIRGFDVSHAMIRNPRAPRSLLSHGEARLRRIRVGSNAMDDLH